jgi:hypothetical protein
VGRAKKPEARAMTPGNDRSEHTHSMESHARTNPQGNAHFQYSWFFVAAIALGVTLLGSIILTWVVLRNLPFLLNNPWVPAIAFAGAIVALVGTYFGIKTMSDAAEEAQRLATANDRDTTQPRVLSTDPLDRAEDVPPDIHLTATFSKDMDTASIKGTDHFTLVRVDAEGTAHAPVAGDVDYGPPHNPLEWPPLPQLMIWKTAALTKLLSPRLSGT